jgi:demethylmenaquinone methyltransferase/2-methoxy-6-polyprenyl-1,4-benzoquinol methylase
VDAVSEKVKEAGIKNVQVLKGDAMDTKLETSSIDVVILFGVIPAPMISTGKLLIEMHRILKPQGVLAIWPTSWTRKEVLGTGLFDFQSKRNGVYNYRRK